MKEWIRPPVLLCAHGKDAASPGPVSSAAPSLTVRPLLSPLAAAPDFGPPTPLPLPPLALAGDAHDDDDVELDEESEDEESEDELFPWSAACQ